MCAILLNAGIDLVWADNQYWCTLFSIINEISKSRTPKQKEKVSPAEMQQFIK